MRPRRSRLTWALLATRLAAESVRRCPGAGAGWFGASGVKPEWRVGVGHESGVGGDAEDPAVHAENEVVDRPGVAAGEEQGESGKEHEEADQSAAGGVKPAVALAQPGGPGSASEDPDDEVLRDREQPPFESTSPRESWSGYATSRPAGYSGPRQARTVGTCRCRGRCRSRSRRATTSGEPRR